MLDSAQSHGGTDSTAEAVSPKNLSASLRLPSTSGQQPRTNAANWRQQLHRLAPLSLPLLPIGAGEEWKAPMNPATGAPLTGWETAAYSAQQIQVMPPRVRAAGARTGTGFLSVDIDGATAVALCLQQGCDPELATTWRVTRDTDASRLKVNFRLSSEQQEQLGQVMSKKARTRPAVKDADGKLLEKAEAVEIFHHTGRQVVVLGEHVMSGGNYGWPDGHGPEALAPIPENWWALVLAIAAGELGLSTGTGSATAPLSPSIAAPRPTPAPGALPPRPDAALTDALAKVPVFTHGEGRRDELVALALRLWVDVGRDRAYALLAAHSPELKDLAGYFKTEPTQLSIGSLWPFLKETYGIDTRRHDLKGSKPTAEEEAAEQDAAAAGFKVWDDVELAADLAKARADREHRQGFKVLGWDADRKVVFYRHRQTSQIASVKPYGPAELLKLAPAAHWEKEHPRINDKGEVIGPAWTDAADWLIEQANHAGVFEPERVRGRGVWLDSGNRVVWHLGDRLEVNGTITRLADHESRHHYGRLPALPINPAVEPLDDAHGRKILAVIKEMGWAGASDYLHVAGHAVTSNVGGALVKRPQLQSESPFGSGKTDNLENVVTPLQAGIGYSSAGSTEAGIRQLVGSDSLPVTVDESEQEDGKKREALLRLVRYNFDGTEQNKGTPSGQGLRFRMRSSIALAGINAPIPNPADRSRIAVVTRKPIPGDQWADVASRRAALITNEVGERLIRRTVTHLPALLANIATFGKVVAAMVTTGDSGRAGDTWGALLAGAHHLTSTAVISEAQALEWIRSVGWDYSHTNSDDTDRAAGAEGRQCLDHLLAHELRWRTALDPEDNRPTTDTITIRELVAMVRSNARSDAGKEAINALGRKGIKVTIDGLVVAHNAPGTQAILSSSKWSNGAHRARLLELPGAAATASPVHFPTDASRRAVLVPWAALDGQAQQPPQAAAAAPPKPAPAAAVVAPAPAPVTQYDWFPAAPPPQEWMEPFSRIAARTPRPAAYKIASELAPDGRVKPAVVSGWLKWLDALTDEFAA